MILSESDSDKQKYIGQTKDLQNDLTKASDEFQKTIAHDDLKDAFRGYQDAMAKYLAARDMLIPMIESGQHEEALGHLRSDTYTVPQKATEVAIEKIKGLKELHAKETADGNSARASFAINIMLLFAGVSAVFAIGCGLWLSAIISKPVKLIAERADRLMTICITNLGKASESMARGIRGFAFSPQISLTW